MNDNFKKSFVFILGREQEIALAELKSVLSRFGFYFDIYKITGNIVFANIDNFSEDGAKVVMNVLGGTVKIFEVVESTEKDLASQISRLIEIRKKETDGKINFGLSYYSKGFSRQNINSIALTAKKKLKGKFSLRYVESRDSFDLSTILTLKNNLLTKGIEFGLFDGEVGVLIAFNNPEEWNRRDYGKPASDKYSGMVPPKLARMMVNLALGEIGRQPAAGSRQKNSDLQTANCLLIDPFCGSGNILMEAMLLGYPVVGSDISDKAVNDTKRNLEWLSENYQISNINYQVLEADATKSFLIENWKIATASGGVPKKAGKIENYDSIAIVCEPYLGEPKKFKSTYKAAVGEYLKVKELYLNFLDNLKQSQKQLTVCIVFPLIETVDRGQFSLYGESVDEIKKLGYTQACNSFVYGRDYQVVKREIVLLEFKQ